VELFQWAVDLGCPIDARTVRFALSSSRRADFARFLVKAYSSKYFQYLSKNAAISVLENLCILVGMAKDTELLKLILSTDEDPLGLLSNEPILMSLMTGVAQSTDPLETLQMVESSSVIEHFLGERPRLKQEMKDVLIRELCRCDRADVLRALMPDNSIISLYKTFPQVSTISELIAYNARCPDGHQVLAYLFEAFDEEIYEFTKQYWVDTFSRYVMNGNLPAVKFLIEKKGKVLAEARKMMETCYLFAVVSLQSPIVKTFTKEKFCLPEGPKMINTLLTMSKNPSESKEFSNLVIYLLNELNSGTFGNFSLLENTLASIVLRMGHPEIIKFAESKQWMSLGEDGRDELEDEHYFDGVFLRNLSEKHSFPFLAKYLSFIMKRATALPGAIIQKILKSAFMDRNYSYFDALIPYAPASVLKEALAPVITARFVLDSFIPDAETIFKDPRSSHSMKATVSSIRYLMENLSILNIAISQAEYVEAVNRIKNGSLRTELLKING